MEESNIKEIVSQLRAITGVNIPQGTLRRWASEGLISRPKLERRGDKRERFWVWRWETVEQAAVIYTLRNKDLPWGKTTKGWPRTKKGKRATIKTKTLLEAKEMVRHLYASVNKSKIEASDFNDLFHLLKPVKMLPKGGEMFGGYALHPIFTSWVTTLEKIRHNRPFSEPLKVIFNWRFHLVQEDAEETLKLKYDGITVESSECEIVSFSVGKFTPEAWKKKFGREPIDWEKAEREGQVMIFDERFVEVQNDGGQRQVIWHDPVTRITIAIKKADPKIWGEKPPWET